MGSFTPDYEAFGAFLRGAEMQAEMRARAERGKAYAESIAPRDTGKYAANFEVEVKSHGGPEGDRAEAILRNTDSPTNVFVEFGTEHNEAQHVLIRSIDAMGD